MEWRPRRAGAGDARTVSRGNFFQTLAGNNRGKVGQQLETEDKIERGFEVGGGREGISLLPLLLAETRQGREVSTVELPIWSLWPHKGKPGAMSV